MIQNYTECLCKFLSQFLVPSRVQTLTKQNSAYHVVFKTSLTVDEKNPKQPPGMVLKRCFNNGIIQLPTTNLNWWVNPGFRTNHPTGINPPSHLFDLVKESPELHSRGSRSEFDIISNDHLMGPMAGAFVPLGWEGPLIINPRKKHLI